MLTINSLLLSLLCLVSGPSWDRLDHTSSVPDLCCVGTEFIGSGTTATWAAVRTRRADDFAIAVVGSEETLTGRSPDMRPQSPRFMSLGIPQRTDATAARRLNGRLSNLNWVPSFDSTADFSTLLGRFQI